MERERVSDREVRMNGRRVGEMGTPLRSERHFIPGVVET
jgi:hypothetical protein